MNLSYWLNELKKGHIRRFYPFLGILDSILDRKNNLLRCGAGHSGYAISTDGKLIACPITGSIKDFCAGDLDTDPDDLIRFDIVGDCIRCPYLGYCGGRCLYWNHSGLWPKKGDQLICSTIKNLIDGIRKIFPEIDLLIKNKTISLSGLEYEKYFGPKIIPS